MYHRCAIKWPLAISVFVCLLFVSAGTSRLDAQGNAGAIHGTVVDQSGHALQGANVAVISESGEKREMLSGVDGKFDLTGVPAGSYTLEIAAPGFQQGSSAPFPSLQARTRPFLSRFRSLRSLRKSLLRRKLTPRSPQSLRRSSLCLTPARPVRRSPAITSMNTPPR